MLPARYSAFTDQKNFSLERVEQKLKTAAAVAVFGNCSQKIYYGPDVLTDAQPINQPTCTVLMAIFWENLRSGRLLFSPHQISRFFQVFPTEALIFIKPLEVYRQAYLYTCT